MSTDAHRIQKTASAPLESGVIGSQELPNMVLGTLFGSSATAVCTLTTELSLQPCYMITF